MVQDGTIGIESGNNEEEKVKPPNRNNYERELGRLNGEIEFLRKQAKTKLNKDGEPGSISEAKQAKEFIRKQREALAQGANKVKAEIVDLRKQLDPMKTARLEVEKDCRVRSRDKLESYLKSCESRYNAQNLSVKEERVLVEEIDALKRNRTKLEKLSEIVRNIGAIEEKMVKLKKSNEETYREIFRLKAEQQTKSAEQRRRVDEFFRIQRGLDTLHDEKRSLIGNYNQQREKYADWAKRHKKHIAYPTSYPNCRQRTVSQCLVEEEELEPFYEQKRDCRRLINYLEKLKNQMELLDASTNTPEKAADSDSDSADEFPSSFARLGVHKKPEEPAKLEPLKPRKIGNLKKATQPISHGYEIYTLFSSVTVTVPASYQEVPRALEEVRERLSFFDQQTNVIDWYAELGDVELALPSMSRSVSEYTGDSACIDSETASLASSRLHPVSPVSPVADPRFSRNPSSNADEGISSKDSHTESTTCFHQ